MRQNKRQHKPTVVKQQHVEYIKNVTARSGTNGKEDNVTTFGAQRCCTNRNMFSNW